MSRIFLPLSACVNASRCGISLRHNVPMSVWRNLGWCVLAAAWSGCGDSTSSSNASATEPPAARTEAAPASRPPYFVYVTNEMSGDLTVIDPVARSAVATIPLGKRPRGIKVDQAARRLFVALSGSPLAPPGVDESKLPPPDRQADGIGVVDIASRKIVTVLNGGTDPEQVAVSLDGARVFVANEDAATASVVEIDGNRILAAVPVGGEPEGVTISPKGNVVYVTSEEDNRVTAIDTATNKAVGQFEVGPRPRSSAFAPDGSRAFVTSENGSNVAVVDAHAHKVIATITLVGENVRPMGVVVSPDGKRLFVTTGRGGTVVSIDATSHKVEGSVRVGERPWGIAASPDGRFLFTANGPSNDVSMVDVDGMRVVATIPAGQRPWGVEIAPAR
jgi:YVTN family beta-propeller protein